MTAAMGLSGAASTAVGATGLGFSGIESSFEAYDSSYLITPELGLLETLVRASQQRYSESVEKDKLLYVSDVLLKLNEYSYFCTFTGMQALIDKSLNKTITEFNYLPFTESIYYKEIQELIEEKRKNSK